jgi:hypothetical protein
MTVVIGDRLPRARAHAIPASRLRKLGQNQNDDGPPSAPETGLTPAQERAIDRLVKHLMNPHDLISGPTTQPDGSVTCEVRSTKDGRYTVSIAPSGKVTRLGPASERDPDSEVSPEV